MKAIRRTFALAVIILASRSAALAQDPLPSWSEGPTKQSIVDFVERVTTHGGSDYVRPAERIAVFDNDGTLWCEKPMYVQLVFAVDRVKILAPQHPEWQHEEPFKSFLADDPKAALADGETAVAKLLAATHTGLTTDEFTKIVRDWITTAKHPRFDRLYVRLAYQPMLELLGYLRANGFKTFIVSGGGVGFMRPWTGRVYGIPPEQVVGSRDKLKFEVRDGTPVLMKLPEIDLIDDKAGKPVGIQEVIGRRPIAAFGNSDGDRQMLEWTTAGDGARFGLLVLHDDAQREYAYGPAEGLPDSKVGTFPQSLYDEAQQRGWSVVRMKDDWKTIFPPQ